MFNMTTCTIIDLGQLVVLASYPAFTAEERTLSSARERRFPPPVDAAGTRLLVVYTWYAISGCTMSINKPSGPLALNRVFYPVYFVLRHLSYYLCYGMMRFGACLGMEYSV